MSYSALRSGTPAIFGDVESMHRWAEAAEAQRADMRARGVRFAVAPAPVTVVTPAGRVLESGTTTTVADWHHGARPAWALLADYVRSGHIVEA